MSTSKPGMLCMERMCDSARTHKSTAQMSQLRLSPESITTLDMLQSHHSIPPLAPNDPTSATLSLGHTMEQRLIKKKKHTSRCEVHCDWR